MANLLQQCPWDIHIFQYNHHVIKEYNERSIIIENKFIINEGDLFYNQRLNINCKAIYHTNQRGTELLRMVMEPNKTNQLTSNKTVWKSFEPSFGKGGVKCVIYVNDKEFINNEHNNKQAEITFNEKDEMVIKIESSKFYDFVKQPKKSESEQKNGAQHQNTEKRNGKSDHTIVLEKTGTKRSKETIFLDASKGLNKGKSDENQLEKANFSRKETDMYIVSENEENHIKIPEWQVPLNNQVILPIVSENESNFDLIMSHSEVAYQIIDNQEKFKEREKRLANCEQMTLNNKSLKSEKLSVQDYNTNQSLVMNQLCELRMEQADEIFKLNNLTKNIIGAKTKRYKNDGKEIFDFSKKVMPLYGTSKVINEKTDDDSVKYVELQKVFVLKKRGVKACIGKFKEKIAKFKETQKKSQNLLEKALAMDKSLNCISINLKGDDNDIVFNCYNPALHSQKVLVNAQHTYITQKTKIPLQTNKNKQSNHQVPHIYIPLENCSEQFENIIAFRDIEYEIGLVHQNNSKQLRHKVGSLLHDGLTEVLMEENSSAIENEQDSLGILDDSQDLDKNNDQLDNKKLINKFERLNNLYFFNKLLTIFGDANYNKNGYKIGDWVVLYKSKFDINAFQKIRMVQYEDEICYKKAQNFYHGFSDQESSKLINMVHSSLRQLVTKPDCSRPQVKNTIQTIFENFNDDLNFKLLTNLILQENIVNIVFKPCVEVILENEALIIQFFRDISKGLRYCYRLYTTIDKFIIYKGKLSVESEKDSMGYKDIKSVDQFRERIKDLFKHC